MGHPAISKHIKVLKRAGLITRGRRAQFRPCTIGAAPLADVEPRHEGASPVIPTKDVQIERTFDAPIDLIWAMWTEAEHFSHWYGPNGAQIPSAEMDVRVGGRRRITMEMHTPNGPMRIHFVGEYRAVDPKTHLAYTESMADADGNPMTAEQLGIPPGMPTETLVVVDLEDLGARTR